MEDLTDIIYFILIIILCCIIGYGIFRLLKYSGLFDILGGLVIIVIMLLQCH